MAKQRTFSVQANPVVNADGKRGYTVFETTDGKYEPISANMTKAEVDALFKENE